MLVNNAAVLTSQHTLLMPTWSAQEMLNTNLLGTFSVSRECAKLMMRKGFGRIISLSSMAVPLALEGDSIYAASKIGLVQFSKILSKELGSSGVTCNIVGITAIETGMMKKVPPDKLKAVIDQLPVSRFAKIDDITNVIDFFASENSSYITGQEIYLGGIS
ncbi:SDR family oxidoreductase [Acidobacteria bacterium AH-259-D05]|nr:SDR family oxidoreductase [Acidobacteria bacterium AH-259-D05]